MKIKTFSITGTLGEDWDEVVNDFLKGKKHGLIDKKYRADSENLSRYSVMTSDCEKIKSNEGDSGPGDLHFKAWDDFSTLGKLTISKDSTPNPDQDGKAIKYLHLFDVGVIRMIEEAGLLAAAREIAKEYYETPIVF